MNYYLVKLRIRLGEYEKVIATVRKSDNADNAGHDALIGECHCELGDGAELKDGGIYDCNGEFFYSVSSSSLVNKDFADTFSKYY